MKAATNFARMAAHWASEAAHCGERCARSIANGDEAFAVEWAQQAHQCWRRMLERLEWVEEYANKIEALEDTPDMLPSRPESQIGGVQ